LLWKVAFVPTLSFEGFFESKDGCDMISACWTNVFHMGHFEVSSVASNTLSGEASIVVEVRMVHRPPVGYVGVGTGDTAEDFVKGDFGEGSGDIVIAEVCV
jgi:hypothetical protein